MSCLKFFGGPGIGVNTLVVVLSSLYISSGNNLFVLWLVLVTGKETVFVFSILQ